VVEGLQRVGNSDSEWRALSNASTIAPRRRQSSAASARLSPAPIRQTAPGRGLGARQGEADLVRHAGNNYAFAARPHRPRGEIGCVQRRQAMKASLDGVRQTRQSRRPGRRGCNNRP